MKSLLSGEKMEARKRILPVSNGITNISDKTIKILYTWYASNVIHSIYCTCMCGMYIMLLICVLKYNLLT